MRARAERVWFAVLLAAVGVYAVGFVARTSFVIGGERVFCLFDDAMISMRFARHLAAGLGPVWNPGEVAVEGFTNPAWTAVMALCHLVPLPPRLASLPVQALAVLIHLGTVAAIWRFAGVLAPGRSAVRLGAAGLVGFYYPLVYWGLMGMEVGALALIITLAVGRAVTALRSGAFDAMPLYLLGAAILLRPDAVVPLAVLTACLGLLDARHRVRYAVVGALSGVSVSVLVTLVRWQVYGSTVPNTSILKLTGVGLDDRLMRGLCTVAPTLAMLAAAAALAVPALRRRGRLHYIPVVAVLVGQLAYSVAVGGDAWEWAVSANRYIAVAMPPVITLLAAGVWRTAVWLARRWGHRAYRGPVYAALVAVVWLALNGGSSGNAVAEALGCVAPAQSQGHREHAAVAVELDGLLAADVRVAVVWAGIVPYLLERPAVDLLGRCDAHVAALPGRIDAGRSPCRAWTPGHDRWDLAYSVGHLKPDVIVELPGTAAEAAPWLGPYRPLRLGTGRTVLLRKGSTAVLWERIDAIRRGR